MELVRENEVWLLGAFRNRYAINNYGKKREEITDLNIYGEKLEDNLTK